MNALGVQLLLELRGCSPVSLNDLPFIRDTLVDAAEVMGATALGQSFHQFDPYGVTGVVTIAESHLCIHTWPEYGYAAVDIFTCGRLVQPASAADYIIKKLECLDPSMIEIKRGMLNQDEPKPEMIAMALRGTHGN